MASEHAVARDGTRPDGWADAGRWVGSGYFWVYGGVGAFAPFAALYFRDLGFSGWQVGILAALPALAVAFAGPLLGAIADSRSMHRAVLRIALGGAALVALAAARPERFWFLLPLLAVLAILEGPLSSTLDGYGITVSERAGTSYGRLRVWGSIGYTLSVLLVGWLMGARVDRIFFLAHALCLGLGLLSTLGLPPLGERTTRPLLSGLGLVTGNRPLLALLFITYLMSSAVALMYGFLGIHLEEMGGSASLLGAASALGATSELPIVAFGGWFIARFGPVRLITLAIGVYAFRFAAFTVIPKPEWVLPVQMLHGLSYGAFLIASVTLAHRLAGQANAATVQALLAAMIFGFGSITGSLIGGVLLDRIGTDGLFRGAAALLVLTLILFLVANRVVGFERPNQPELEVTA